MELIACHSKTHQGPYFSINEDTYHFDIDNDIFMVLDAFGGSGVGDEVLKLICDTTAKFFENITQDPEATQPFYYNAQLSLEANALINSLTYTHKLILKNNNSKSLGQRAAASGIFLVKSHNHIDIINIGSTKALLVRNNQVSPLLEEQSLNKFKSADIGRVPSFALGFSKSFHYQIQNLKVEKNDQLLLMTDGVHSSLDLNDFSQQDWKNGSSPQIIENLFQLANNKGNQDNQTLIILEF